MRSGIPEMRDHMIVLDRQLLTGTCKAVTKHMASYQVLLDKKGALTFLNCGCWGYNV